jgi:IclR family pca regulon transcriptional regulator
MKSLATALKVLCLFGGAQTSWTVTGIARETGLNKSQVSKILSQFRNSGLLQRDPISREYLVAPFAVALAGNFVKSSALCREALGPMRHIVNDIDQTATLCIMVGEEVMYVSSVEGIEFIDHGWRVGGWIPFHCTAAGKVLVSALPESEVDLLIEKFGLPRHTPHTICSVRQLKRQLKEIARSGVAITHSEGTAGLGAIAVPILGADQKTIAALGTVYAEHRIGAEQEVAFTRRLHQAAQQLSYKLGARIYPYGGGGDP